MRRPWRWVWLPIILVWTGCGPVDGPDAELAKVEPGIFYELDDGERAHDEAPDTFKIPPKTEREDLHPGQIVKLMFRIFTDDDEQVERMWVEVLSKDDHGYTGKLDNQPVSTDAIHPGARIHFEPRHVIAVYHDKDKGPA